MNSRLRCVLVHPETLSTKFQRRSDATPVLDSRAVNQMQRVRRRRSSRRGSSGLSGLSGRTSLQQRGDSDSESDIMSGSTYGEVSYASRAAYAGFVRSRIAAKPVVVIWSGVDPCGQHLMLMRRICENISCLVLHVPCYLHVDASTASFQPMFGPVYLMILTRIRHVMFFIA